MKDRVLYTPKIIQPKTKEKTFLKLLAMKTLDDIIIILDVMILQLLLVIIQ